MPPTNHPKQILRPVGKRAVSDVFPTKICLISRTLDADPFARVIGRLGGQPGHQHRGEKKRRDQPKSTALVGQPPVLTSPNPLSALP